MTKAKITEFAADRITFLREQDGLSERVLKQELILLFRSWPAVRAAYLIQSVVDGLGAVTLCVDNVASTPETLVDQIRCIFSRLFSEPAALDVLFLTADQRAEVAAVSLPFYTNDACP